MLTVIICTYNREKYIRPLLESMARNTLVKSEYEILMVDNNCADNTRGVCTKFAEDYPDVNFRYTVEKEQGLSAARNCGISEAKGDLIVYVDDDAVVDENYLEDYVQWFESHPDTMALGGPIIPMYEVGGEPRWMSYYTRALLTGWLDYGKDIKKFPAGRYPGGGNAAYRKCVFEKVGMFNTALGRKGGNLMASEEKDIFDKMSKLGMEILYLPTPVLHHSIPPEKLGKDYFERLTLQIGRSERARTKSLGFGKYLKRLFMECVKWGGTILLSIVYSLQGCPAKGLKLIQLRWNVTKGLVGKQSYSPHH